MFIFYPLCYTVPFPNVKINTSINQTVSQSLTLQCNIITVRGITSRVEILWISNGIELKKKNSVNASVIMNTYNLYEDTYDIPLLSTSDDGSLFQCKGTIMTTPSITVANNITLDVIGK